MSPDQSVRHACVWMLEKATFTSNLGTIAWHFTGSRRICNPAPELESSSDWDFCFLVKDFNHAHKLMLNAGWVSCGDYLSSDSVLAYRRSKTNFLITANQDTYERFHMACGIATLLNARDKSTRVEIFKCMRENRNKDLVNTCRPLLTGTSLGATLGIK